MIEKRLSLGISQGHSARTLAPLACTWAGFSELGSVLGAASLGPFRAKGVRYSVLHFIQRWGSSSLSLSLLLPLFPLHSSSSSSSSYHYDYHYHYRYDNDLYYDLYYYYYYFFFYFYCDQASAPAVAATSPEHPRQRSLPGL